MSSNPEQFPQSSADNAGSNPNDNPAHIEGTPYDKTSMKEAIAKGDLKQSVDTDTLHLVASSQNVSDRSPFRELPAPASEKQKSKLGKLLAMGAAGIVLITGGTILGANITKGGDNKNDNLPPEPEQTASAPTTPGAGEQTEPSVSDPVENPPVAGEMLPVEDMLFTNADGEQVSFEELSESVKLSSDEWEGMPAQREFFNRINDMINYQFTLEEVSRNANVPIDELRMDDFMEVASVYYSAYDTLFQEPSSGAPSGKLYDTLHGIAEQTTYDRVNTLYLNPESSNPQDTELYEVTIETDTNMSQLTVTDNSPYNIINDNGSPMLGTYNLRGGMNDFKSIGGAWRMDPNVSITKAE